ncbi:MAG: nucleotidyltransferase domain-containing protein [Candidatus Rokuibacteriota bacterium]
MDEALRAWAQQAAAEQPGVRRIGYFGSYARGDWGVGSDVDVVIVVAEADVPFQRRSLEWDLTGLPVPADVLVYTESEWLSLDPRSRMGRTLRHETIWVYAAAMTPEDRRSDYVRRLDAAPRRIVEVLSDVEGIQRISIFGSYARGRRDLFTDLDMLIVWQTDKPWLERLRFLHAVLDVGVDLDVICYTPDELQRMQGRPFLRQALTEEVVLLEKRTA